MQWYIKSECSSSKNQTPEQFWNDWKVRSLPISHFKSLFRLLWIRDYSIQRFINIGWETAITIEKFRCFCNVMLKGNTYKSSAKVASKVAYRRPQEQGKWRRGSFIRKRLTEIVGRRKQMCFMFSFYARIYWKLIGTGLWSNKPHKKQDSVTNWPIISLLILWWYA